MSLLDISRESRFNGRLKDSRGYISQHIVYPIEACCGSKFVSETAYKYVSIKGRLGWSLFYNPE